MTQNSSAFLLFPRNTTSTRLTLRTEGMKVYCGVNKLISSNTASQQRNVSSAVLCWSKVAWNTIRGESSFRTAANHFPWADFESCCLFFFFFKYSCISSQSFWIWLKLAVLRAGFQPNERVCSSLCLTLGYRRFRKQKQSRANISPLILLAAASWTQLGMGFHQGGCFASQLSWRATWDCLGETQKIMLKKWLLLYVPSPSREESWMRG